MVNVLRLDLPLDEQRVRALRAGDVVLLNGALVTGRDRVHKFLVEQKPPAASLPFGLNGSVLYHCGPIIRKEGDTYRVIAAGPTTSIRVEMYQADVLCSYGIRGVMGKGGMGPKTLAALKECGAVYFHAIGGAAAYLADRIVQTLGVWKLEEFGLAEAMWCLRVEDFPAVVTMDSEGNSLHRDIEAKSREILNSILAK